jgi:type VI secretion system secreted protein Hcp
MAVDMFLKLDGIDGESTDAKHKGEIEIESFSWGASNPGSAAHGGGGGSGKVSMQDFHFTTRVSRASPQLFLACASGEHIRSALFTVRKAGAEQAEFLKVTMSDLLISSWQQAGASGDADVPTDQVSINFSKISMEYRMQDAKGALGDAVSAGWDVGKNVKL